jgi:hypothetical protein
MSAPPTPEDLIGMMQGMLVEDPQQNAVIFLSSGGQDIVVPCIDHPVDTLALLETAVHRGALAKPDWIAVVSDTYSIVVPEKEMPPMRPGLLGEMFAAGDPRVRESVLACCFAPDGPSYGRQQRYTRTGDVFVWDEPEDLPLEAMGGEIANGMRRILGMEQFVDDRALLHRPGRLAGRLAIDPQRN